MRTKRSHYNVNRVGHYNIVDAKIDNPHKPRRELNSVIQAANEIRFRPRGMK